MKPSRLHLELLLGRQVHDVSGKPAGRIEEVRARAEAGECVIEEYLLGRGGLLERLSVAHVLSAVVSLLGGYGTAAAYRVPWDQMDLTDPTRPRLKCSAENLEQLKPHPQRGGSRIADANRKT
jgi:hypothetical protein